MIHWCDTQKSFADYFSTHILCCLLIKTLKGDNIGIMSLVYDNQVIINAKEKAGVMKTI